MMIVDNHITNTADTIVEDTWLAEAGRIPRHRPKAPASVVDSPHENITIQLLSENFRALSVKTRKRLLGL